MTNAAVNLMTNEATVHYDPAGTDPAKLVSAINDTGYVSHLPAADSSASSEDEAREQAQAREYAVLLTKCRRQRDPRRAGDDRLHAADGRQRSSRACDAIRSSRWAMRVLDPPVRRLLPWLYAIDPGTLLFLLLASTTFVMAWAGRHFYVGAWKSLQPWFGKHEHADCDRHRCGVRLFCRRDRRARAVCRGAAPAPMCITKR